jgi:hypothetical protein
MSYSQKNKRKRAAISELDIFLTTEMGFFGWFKGKKIKFNPRPFSEKKKLDETEKNLVDFHLEMVKKIDALIEEHEREKEIVFEEEPDSISQEKLEDSLEEIVEIRESFKRKLDMPNFKTEMQSENIFDNIDVEKEEFETTLPGEIHHDFKFVTSLEEPKDIVYIRNIESEHVKDDDFHSRMLDGQNKATQSSAMGFARVKSKKETANLKEQKTKNKKQKIISKTQNKGTKVITTKKKKSKKKKKELGEKAKLETKKKRLEAKHALKEEKRKKKEAERQKKLKMKTTEKKKESVKNLLFSKKSDKIFSKTEKKKTGIFTKKEKPSLLATKHLHSRKKNLEQEQSVLDDDIRKVLLITDNLLEKLPEDVIDEFVQSDDFSLYEKVISKYKTK